MKRFFIFCSIFVFSLILIIPMIYTSLEDPFSDLPIEDSIFIGDEEETVSIAGLDYKIRNGVVYYDLEGRLTRIKLNGGEDSYFEVAEEIGPFDPKPIKKLDRLKEGENNDFFFDEKGQIIKASFIAGEEGDYNIGNMEIYSPKGGIIEYDKEALSIKIKVPEGENVRLPKQSFKNFFDEFLEFNVEIGPINEGEEFNLLTGLNEFDELKELKIKGTLNYEYLGYIDGAGPLSSLSAFKELSIGGIEIQAEGRFYLDINNDELLNALSRSRYEIRELPQNAPFVSLSNIILDSIPPEQEGFVHVQVHDESFQLGFSLEANNPGDKEFSLNVPEKYFGNSFGISLEGNINVREFKQDDERVVCNFYIGGDSQINIFDNQYSTKKEDGRTQVHYPLIQPNRKEGTQFNIIPGDDTEHSIDGIRSLIRTQYGEEVEITIPTNPEHQEKRQKYINPLDFDEVRGWIPEVLPVEEEMPIGMVIEP